MKEFARSMRASQLPWQDLTSCRPQELAEPKSPCDQANVLLAAVLRLLTPRSYSIKSAEMFHGLEQRFVSWR
jgi:hypothetical protein